MAEQRPRKAQVAGSKPARGSILWVEDCLRYWDTILVGDHRHWCPDWDYLPIDETCEVEYDCCTCFTGRKVPKGTQLP